MQLPTVGCKVSHSKFLRAWEPANISLRALESSEAKHATRCQNDQSIEFSFRCWRVLCHALPARYAACCLLLWPAFTWTHFCTSTFFFLQAWQIERSPASKCAFTTHIFKPLWSKCAATHPVKRLQRAHANICLKVEMLEMHCCGLCCGFLMLRLSPLLQTCAGSWQITDFTSFWAS